MRFIKTLALSVSAFLAFAIPATAWSFRVVFNRYSELDCYTGGQHYLRIKGDRNFHQGGCQDFGEKPFRSFAYAYGNAWIHEVKKQSCDILLYSERHCGGESAGLGGDSPNVHENQCVVVKPSLGNNGSALSLRFKCY
ncbi:hypothetical protein LTR08_004819 [Meristemomyces frigidus]|nr:hypothetical protein LTR08_004819 [Meristemomyces frigidus]